MKTLILIDIQNDYFPNGKHELVGAEKAAENAKKILDKFRAEKRPIIHIKHISVTENASFFLPNTLGVEINKAVQPLENEKLIVKHYPNSFRETELQAYLQSLKTEHLVVVGMMTHMCVAATVRAAKDNGYSIELIADACATKDLKLNWNKLSSKNVQTAFLAALNYFYAEVKTTEKYLK